MRRAQRQGMAMARTAIVLFNLGGPDRLESVKPFLFNLFYDPAITEMAAPFRWLFAKLITAKREKAVQANYALMGGKTPLLAETSAQMQALELALADLGEIRCFMAMRYWHPLSEAAVAEVAAWRPDRILLLPLYPHYSAATTGSSLDGLAPGGTRRRARRPDPDASAATRSSPASSRRTPR